MSWTMFNESFNWINNPLCYIRLNLWNRFVWLCWLYRAIGVLFAPPHEVLIEEAPPPGRLWKAFSCFIRTFQHTMRYASDCYASGPRSIGSLICTFIRTCTSRSPIRSSSREAPPIYSWFRIQIWNWNGLCLHLCYWFENQRKHLWSVNGLGIGSLSFIC